MNEARSRATRLVLAAVLVLSVMTAGLLLGSCALLFTGAGTAWVGQQLAALTGNAVAWDSIEGTLAGPLTLRGVRLSQPGLDASVDQLVLEWEPPALLRGELSVTRLAAHGIRLDLSDAGADETGAPFRPSDLELPLNLSLALLQLTDLEVIQGGEPVARLDQLNLGASLTGDRLELHSLALDLPGGSLEARGQLALADQMPFALALHWAWAVPAGDGAAPLSGTAGLEGELSWGEALAFDLEYVLEARGLQQLLPELPPRLVARGAAGGEQASGSLDIARLAVGFDEIPARLELAGRLLALDTPEPELAIEAAWQQLAWPPAADQPLVASAGGSLALSGNPGDYRIEAQASLVGENLPPGDWRLAGRGNTRGIELERLAGQVLEGRLTLRGDLWWSPEPRWDLRVDGEGLDPAVIDGTLTGDLGLSASTSGALEQGEVLQATVDLEQLSGTLLDYPVELRAQARVQGDTLQLHSLAAMSGANEVVVSGAVSPDSLDLGWQLRAADPGLFLPGSRGLISGQGSLAGPLQAPRVQADLASDQLLLQGSDLRDLRLVLGAGLAPDSPLEGALSGSLADAGEQSPALSVDLQLSGTNRQHELRLLVNRGEQRAQVLLAGGAGELDAWRGELRDLRLQEDTLGRWQLRQPAALSASPGAASLARACLASADGQGEACTRLSWQREGTAELAVDIEGLPLESLAPAMRSRIDGQVVASLASDGQVTAAGQLSLSAGELRLESADEVRWLPHGGGSLALDIDGRGLRAELGFDAPARGRLDASVALPALRSLPPAETQALEGRLQAQLPDLSVLAAWIEPVSSSEGSLTADLSLGGSLQSPQVEGQLRLSDGAVEIPPAGIRIHGIGLEARSDPARPGRLLISGGARSGPGGLALAGSADLAQTRVDLELTGERFLAYDTVDARAYISPDLQIGWYDQLLHVRGRLEIPQASLTPQLQLGPGAVGAGDAAGAQSASVVAPSTDVVVVNGPEELAPPAGLPLRIDSEIEIVLGDRVDVNALGFISRLPGAVVLSNSPGQGELIPAARGQLAIEDGTFRAFGQDLDIESGQIIFAGGPATEPELNLRAVRWIDNDPTVTAVGVIVTGPATAPTLTLFSRPQLDPGEIQSYLLTGRSSNNRDSVLSIGTYLTPRLYVGYGYNLLRGTNEFNSLFSITPRIGVGGNFGEADNNLNMTVTYEH